MLSGKSLMYSVCHAECILFCFLESYTSAWCVTPIACALELRQCPTDSSMIRGHCPRLLQRFIVLIHHSKSTTVKMVCNHFVQTQQLCNFSQFPISTFSWPFKCNVYFTVSTSGGMISQGNPKSVKLSDMFQNLFTCTGVFHVDICPWCTPPCTVG